MEIKVNFLFSQGKQGWSETYYTTAGDLATGYAQAFTLAQARALLMSEPCQLDFIRVSDRATLRASQIANVGPDGANLIDSNPNYHSDAGEAQDCMLLTLYATSANKQRPLYIHGYPDDALDTIDPNNPDAQLFFQKLNDYRTALKNGQWFILNKPAFDPANGELITGLAPGQNPKTTTINTGTALGVNADDYVEVYKVTGLRPRIGTQRVLSVTNNGLDITVGYTLPSGFTYGGGAYVLQSAESLNVIEDSNIRGFTSHKVGRPFGVSRGRRVSIHP